MKAVISEVVTIVPKSTIPNYIYELRGKISNGFWFVHNWFGLGAFFPFLSPKLRLGGLALMSFFSLLDELSTNPAHFAMAWHGMFSFVMVWASSPFLCFVSNICLGFLLVLDIFQNHMKKHHKNNLVQKINKIHTSLAYKIRQTN
jgi:hypothetical protein